MALKSSISPPPSISIGPFQLYPSQRLLVKDDVAVKLGGRAFDILSALSERPGEVVSQKELIERAWPNVFVEDVSLRFHIGALRKALGCDGTRYLINVPGRGYSLVAPVTRHDPALPSSRVAEPLYRLPPELMRMVGREEAVEEVRNELISSRFVSIVGLGGVGKTTVALSVAHALLGYFQGAVCFVDLSPIGSLQALPATVVSALGLPARTEDPIPELISYLRAKRVLLVLDSCEHLIDGAAHLAERLIAAVPGLHLLTTSREALRCQGEKVHLLAPLLNPPEDGAFTAAAALAYPAVRLFVDRAASAGYSDELGDEDAEAVGAMCRQLGGIALAIELAAGHAARHGIADTARQLSTQFALFWPGRRTAPERQKTLNATLDWSYRLLSATECAVLRRLSVFAGSFSAEAALRVATAPLRTDEVTAALTNLVARFLVSTETGGASSRYRLLDTTRAYSRQKLDEAGERDDAQRHHANYYCDRLKASAATAADLDDIRCALRWAFEEGGDVLIGADIAAYSSPLWLGKGLLVECRSWMAKVMHACRRATGVPEEQQLRIQFAFAASELFASAFTEETIAAWRETLDRAEALNDLPTELLCYAVLWAGEIRAARYSDALATAERCAVRTADSDDVGALAHTQWLLGHSKHHLARFEETRRHLELYLTLETNETRLTYAKVSGYDRRVDALCIISNAIWMLGQPDQAMVFSKQALADAQALGFIIPLSLAMLWNLLNAYLMEHDTDQVDHYAVELLELSRAHGIHSDSGFALCIIGLCQAKRGEYDAGAPLVAEGLRMLTKSEMEAFSTLVRAHICEAAVAANRLDEAVSWAGELERNDRNQDHWCSSEVLRVRGLIARAQGDASAATALYEEAIKFARRQKAISWELRATLALCRLWSSQRRWNEALQLLDPLYAQFKEGFGTADLLEAARVRSELNVALGTA